MYWELENSQCLKCIIFAHCSLERGGGGKKYFHITRTSPPSLLTASLKLRYSKLRLRTSRL